MRPVRLNYSQFAIYKYTLILSRRWRRCRCKVLILFSCKFDKVHVLLSYKRVLLTTINVSFCAYIFGYLKLLQSDKQACLTPYQRDSWFGLFVKKCVWSNISISSVKHMLTFTDFRYLRLFLSFLSKPLGKNYESISLEY